MGYTCIQRIIFRPWQREGNKEQAALMPDNRGVDRNKRLAIKSVDREKVKEHVHTHARARTHEHTDTDTSANTHARAHATHTHKQHSLTHTLTHNILDQQFCHDLAL